jgi:hypothetical protein
MISRLQEINFRLAHPVNESVFLIDSPRPSASECELQRLWFAYTGEWILKDRLDQFEDSKRRAAICFHPVAKILPEFRMEHRYTLNGPAQDPSRAVNEKETAIFPVLSRLGASRSTNVWRSSEIEADGRFP